MVGYQNTVKIKLELDLKNPLHQAFVAHEFRRILKLKHDKTKWAGECIRLRKTWKDAMRIINPKIIFFNLEGLFYRGFKNE